MLNGTLRGKYVYHNRELDCKNYYLNSVGGDLNALASMFKVSVAQLNSLNIQSFFVKNLLPVTLGNIVGGLFFVGLVGFMANKFDMKKSKFKKA